MKKIIDMYYDKIIVGLSLLIMILLSMLFLRPAIPEKTKIFLDRFKNPLEKVHAVQFLSTNKDGGLVTFDTNLDEIIPCKVKYDDSNTPSTKEQQIIKIPDITECLNFNGLKLQPIKSKIQYEILIPAKVVSSEKSENINDLKAYSFLISIVGDPRVYVSKKYCPPDGDC